MLPAMVSRRQRRRRLRFVVTAVVAATAIAVVWMATDGGSIVAQVRHAVTGKTSDAPVALDPSAFATGACEAFEPTHGNRHKTVFLDAGHGGIDPGGVGATESGTTISESTINLAIELDTMALLRADGYRVVVSRTRDTTVMRLTSADVTGDSLTLEAAHNDVVARDQCANLAHADVLVGIYMDAGSTDSEAGSVSVYDAARPFASSNRHLARLLQRNVLRVMNAQGWQIPNDGVHDDTTYGSVSGSASEGGIAAEATAYDHLLLIGPAHTGYFTSPSEMPGAVIEPLYLTDPFEGSIADSTADQKIMATGYAAAIEQYFTPVTTSTSTTAS
jgi:N-acetylmuramoyl-L-alanine amidase